MSMRIRGRRSLSGSVAGSKRIPLGVAALTLLGTCLCCLALGVAAQTAPSAAASKDQQRNEKREGQGKKQQAGKQNAASRYGAKPPRVDAKAWILIDARDDSVLAAKNPDSERMIASTTKMMTAYVAHQLLAPSKVVRAPRYRATPGESLAGLEGGDRISVRDLLYALLLPSGNDAAEALSKLAQPSEKRFVVAMNAQARRLGLAHTHFSTPVGLDEPGNYSSAHDLAQLAQALLDDPLLARIVDTERRTIRADKRRLELVNHNNLLLAKPWISGVKTGYTSSAGYTLVAAGRKDNTTLISVVMGTPSESARDRASLDLLGWGFSRYQRFEPVTKGEQVVSTGLDFRDTRIPLLAGRSLPVLARDGQQVRVETDAPDELTGPVSKGQDVGDVMVTVDGVEAATAPLVTGTAAPAATLSQKAKALALSPLICIPIGLLLLLAGFVLVFRSRSKRGDNPGRRA